MHTYEHVLWGSGYFITFDVESDGTESDESLIGKDMEISGSDLVLYLAGATEERPEQFEIYRLVG
jgi:hypothetical protein